MRVMLCDDEGIVLEALRFMLEKNLEESCEIETARNGRTAIELAEHFHPDIVVIDIQMPGMNGLDAMEEMKKRGSDSVFIILTAYDVFSYSQRAIELGAFSYLTKPIRQEVFIDTVRKAWQLVKTRRTQTRENLEIKEKLEIVVPMIESGFIYSVLLGTVDSDTACNYFDLLSIRTESAYAIVIDCGDTISHGHLQNTVGAGIRLKKQEELLRAYVKESVEDGIVGTLAANRLIVFAGSPQQEGYEERVRKIERLRLLVRQLERQCRMSFKIGIGSVTAWADIRASYRQALDAIARGPGKVNHVQDIAASEHPQPFNAQEELLRCVERGDEEGAAVFVQRWMPGLYTSEGTIRDECRLAVLAIVLAAQERAKQKGVCIQSMRRRSSYFRALMDMDTFEQLELWMTDRLTETARLCGRERVEKAGQIPYEAKCYIDGHFTEDISLDDVARHVSVSPYYLSKVFKETEGVNYTEYLNRLRIQRAKDQLSGTRKSMKEICVEVGYQDPNYFSRIFKKTTGMTPTEYRDGFVGEGGGQ